MKSRTPFAYIWAFPSTAPGLIVGCFALLSGGKLQIKNGVLEFYGGFAQWILKHPSIGAKAMTLGHVVLGQNAKYLHDNRPHEHAHVDQAEVLGPFFIPAYLTASFWAFIQGLDYYEDNWFERDADNRSKKYQE